MTPRKGMAVPRAALFLLGACCLTAEAETLR